MDFLFNSSPSLKKLSIPFSDANLRQVNIIANLHSNLFQTVAYYNYNHFEIQLWLDVAAEVDGEAPAGILETLDSEAIERVFVQCLALWNMAMAMEWNFIDFTRFQLLPESSPDGPNYFSAKFPIRLPLSHTTATSGKEKDTELKHLLACFQKNKHLHDVNERNYTELFNRLKRKYSFSRRQVYVYKYNEFASALLNAYPIDELKNEANIKIKIRTADPVQEKIVKRHLYRNYVAEDIFFVDVANHSPDGGLPQCIASIISEPDAKESESDPVSVIQRLDLFLRKSSFKFFVLVIDQLKSREDAEFLNYLAHSSGISNIVLIVFDTPGGDGAGRVEFDLELNETPGNLLEDYLHFDKPGAKIPLKSRDEEIDSLRSFLEKTDLTGAAEPPELLNDDIKTLLAENLDFLEKKAGSGEKACQTHRLLVDILLKQGDTALAASLIRDHLEKDPVFMKLKLAQVYRVEKEHPRMHQLLEEIKGDISEPWLDEFNYLNYIYYEKVSDVKTADRYLKKIQKPLFIHLANVKLSDRFIYEGNFEKARQLLAEAAAYLDKQKYPEDEIDALNQMAKLLRQKQQFGEAEKLYKNLFIKSEMNRFRLFSAYISVDLGNLYFSRDDFNQAEVWYRKALKIFQSLKNKNGIMLAESNLVEVDKIKGNWQETETYLKSILAYDKERKSLDSMAIDYINIAHLEYLKHNDTGAREYLQKALDLFEKRKNAAGIIECELLSLKLSYLFPGAPAVKHEASRAASAVPVKYRDHMTPDQEILFSVFDMLMSKKGRSSRQANFTAKVLNKIEQIQSATLRFEMLSLWILAAGPGKPGPLEPLKSLSMQLSMKTRNYYFYEYYYTYFNNRVWKDRGNDNNDDENTNGDTPDTPGNDGLDHEKDIFMDMYYFFLRNKRKLTPAIIKYKNRLDEKDAVYDMFRNAELVQNSFYWKMPEDFFNNLVKEIKKNVAVDRVQLDMYETAHKSPVFRFSTEARFKEVTAEIMNKARHGMEDINLTLEEIKRSYKSNEKAFYYYGNTKALSWRLSDTLFGILLLGFLKEDYFDYNFNERNPELLKKMGPLIHKYYENNFKVNRKLNWIIGESPVMKRLKEQILKVGKVDFAVLIRGESGSGKDLVARGVHHLSKRSGKPFVAVNAAAIPENLLEAELFGYKKGAFTGAVESKMGLIEAANQGTLFLDEIADLPLNLQAKMLRVLQENEIRRLGETNASKVDFRLICASNKDLKKLIKQNEFREDLYFRIQDLTIDVPPLAERTGDIPLLVHHFLEKYNFPVKDKSELERITRYLEGQTWTGSVRELEATIKRMITYYPDFEIEAENDYSQASSPPATSTTLDAGGGLVAARENLERTMIYNALRENEWNKQRAANVLKISRQYIAILMKKYGISE